MSERNLTDQRPGPDGEGQIKPSELWPKRPESFPDLMRPVEAAQYLRLDELKNHRPITALRTLRYWRDKGQLKGTKFARHIWFLKSELDRFLTVKTEA